MSKEINLTVPLAENLHEILKRRCSKTMRSLGREAAFIIASGLETLPEFQSRRNGGKQMRKGDRV